MDADILNGSCDVWGSRNFLPYILYNLLWGVRTITLDSWLVYLLTATIDGMLIKHVLSHFTKFVKTRFLAQKSGSQLRCRTMLKMLWNIQKTPPKHVKRLLNFLFLNTVLGSNIRFSAQMSNNAKKKWNNQKTPTKHVLRLLKNFLKIWFSAQKSGSRLRCRTMRKNTLKHPENTNKTCFEAFWEFLENPVLGSKVWFSAQISNYAKIH